MGWLVATAEPSSRVIDRVTVDATPVALAIAMPLRMTDGADEASTYMRNAVPMVTGTPASESVIVPGLKEKMTSGVGAAPPPAGTIRTLPEVSPADAADITSFCELLAATEYDPLFPTWPLMFTLAGAPGVLPDPRFRNCAVPVCTESVGFTRMICVPQPSPTAKWGTTCVPVLAALDVSITGSVVSRESL